MLRELEIVAGLVGELPEEYQRLIAKIIATTVRSIEDVQTMTGEERSILHKRRLNEFKKRLR